MKKLSRKHKIALVELVVILAVAVYFFFPGLSAVPWAAALTPTKSPECRWT